MKGRSDSPRLVGGVIARPQTPGRISAIAPAMAVRMIVVLRAWRQAEVHEVGDVGLPFPAVERTHVELAVVSPARCLLELLLTDSEMASSSTLAKRFEALCCFRPCWLPRGVGVGRAAAPKLLPLRRWP